MEVSDDLAEKAIAPFDKKVAASAAGIAAALAIVSVIGQFFANQEILLQTKSADQWAMFQAKSTRRYQSDIARDLFKSQSGEAAARAAETYAANAERYQKEGDEVQSEAHRLQEESEHKGRQALRLHLGEIFIEIGIVFASLAILTKRQLIWIASLACAGFGIGVALTTFFVAG